TLSSYWLYLFNGPSEDYWSWLSINENTPVNTGRGFSMKGTGSVGSADQNYSFRGQPNTGTITEPVAGNHAILVGNPYPSAIDSHAFSYDNQSALSDGVIRYWRHSTTNNSHVLSAYEGGYAIYSPGLEAGVAA